MKPTLILEKNEHPWQLFDKTEKSFRFQWHYHDEYELFIPMEGSWKYLIGNMQGEIEPGQAFFLPPRLPHAFFTLTDAKPHTYRCYVLFFCLPLDVVNRIAGYDLSAMLMSRYKGGARLANIQPLIAELHRMTQCPEGLPSAIAFLESMAFLLQARNATPLAQSSISEHGASKTSEAITRIGDYLARHYRERLTLEAIAEATFLTVPTMCRLFRKSTGRSVFEYLRELRLSRVRSQLMWTDHAIDKIAWDSGFETLGHFYRSFRAVMGISPAAYRRSIKTSLRPQLHSMSEAAE